MIVETYELSELAEQTADDADECAKLAESLGLAGQQKYLSTPDTPACPYRVVTAEEGFVYAELCPKTVEVSKYADGPIPLRVLQVIAHARTIPLFKFLQVWCPATPREPDPVLVGVDVAHDWMRTPSKSYLLARWGDVLETFEVLMARAVKRAESRLEAAWRSIAAKSAARASAGFSVDPSKGPLQMPALFDNE